MVQANASPQVASLLPPPVIPGCFYLHCSLVLLPLDAELLLRIRNRALLISVLAQCPVYSKLSTAKFKDACLR